MRIGNQVWDPEDQKQYLDEFFALYNNRPIQDNTGGMKSPHMFNAWYVIKKLKPKFIIESGVWKGQGTWFFENASPDSTIISIDPYPNFRQITSQKANYITHDFTQLNWASEIDTRNALVFFDDHQNCTFRLKHCVLNNFQHVMFEDNYPYNQGDCYSPKKILSQKSYVIDQNGSKVWYDHNTDDYNFLLSVIETYQELPPIYKNLFTRWGDKWNYSYETPDPLLNQSDSNKYPMFFNERLDYTWICYMILKNIS